MVVLDFVSLVLQSHGRTLQSLCELVDIGPTLEILERGAEQSIRKNQNLKILNHVGGTNPDPHHPFEEIERIVESIGLPKEVEFFVWSYPYYRQLVEGQVHWTKKLDPSTVELLLTEAREDARSWIEDLPVVDPFRTKFIQKSDEAWLKFRSEVLQKLGSRPLQALS